MAGASRSVKGCGAGGIPPPGRGWELVFRLQAQAGAQSLDAKATVGHGHGHLCGDPGKGDFPREMAKET